MLLEAYEISRCYGEGSAKVTALHPTSLSIGFGEFVAIVGPSGSGKSTLMNIMGLLDAPSVGHLLIEGVDCGSLKPRALADLRNRRIGFIFQSYQLLPRLTALQNVALPLVYAGDRRSLRNERAAMALESVGLAHKSGRLPSQLSGGEQQRVAIARAIINDPALILADEPTGALDTAAGRGVLDLLARLHEQGRTIVIVTHDASIARVARRIVTMRDSLVIGDCPASTPSYVQLEAVR